MLIPDHCLFIYFEILAKVAKIQSAPRACLKRHIYVNSEKIPPLNLLPWKEVRIHLLKPVTFKYPSNCDEYSCIASKNISV